MTKDKSKSRDQRFQLLVVIPLCEQSSEAQLVDDEMIRDLSTGFQLDAFVAAQRILGLNDQVIFHHRFVSVENSSVPHGFLLYPVRVRPHRDQRNIYLFGRPQENILQIIRKVQQNIRGIIFSVCGVVAIRIS